MAGKEVHFEIFRRQGAKGGWTLHEVVRERVVAIRTAEELFKGGGATGVKIIKETYDSDSGDYLSLKIYEEGHNSARVEPAAEDVPHALPCFKPDDLYSYHARATMTRLLSDWLARNKLTITELTHRADALEKLEATGTVYQHAIQKVAVAQASSTTTPVQQIVKSLNDLATKAMNQVYRDEHKKVFAVLNAGQFGAYAAEQGDGPGARYLLNGAVAKYLADAKGWEEKLKRLLALMDEIPDEGPGQTLLLGAVDSLCAEMLGGSAAITDLLGGSTDLGAALARLVKLFMGAPSEGEPCALDVLARHFAKDELSEARTAIANRILAELKSTKRLCPSSMEDELKMLRKLANELVHGQGKYLSHENLIAAFTLRSRRLVSHEFIGQLLDGAEAPETKLERLLLVEENIIGAENKRILASFVTPLIASPNFANAFVYASTPAFLRLQKLATLQTRVLRSGFQDIPRAEIARALDDVASQAEARGKILESLAAKSANPVEAAQALLKLFLAPAITEGTLSAKARKMLLAAVGRPGFFTGYANGLAKAGGPTDPQVAMTELMGQLEKAGVPPEDAATAIAA